MRTQVIFFTLIMLNASLMAQTTINEAEVSSDKFCQSLMSSRKKLDEIIKEHGAIKSFFYRLEVAFSNRMAKPMVNNSSPRSKKSQQIYVLISIPEFTFKKMTPTRTELRLLKKYRRQIRNFAKNAKSMKKCLRMVERKNFNYSDYQELEKELAPYLMAKKKKQFLKNLRFLNRKYKGLAEVVLTPNLYDWMQSQPELSEKNFIYVGHSDQYNNLYDGQSQRILKSFFNLLEEFGVKSTTLYACRSNEVAKKYLLDHMNQVGVLPKKSWLAIWGHKTPLGSLPFFLKKLKRKLPISGGREAIQKNCTLKFEFAKLTPSTYSLSLQKKMIGILGGEKGEIPVSCELMASASPLRFKKWLGEVPGTYSPPKLQFVSKTETIDLTAQTPMYDLRDGKTVQSASYTW